MDELGPVIPGSTVHTHRPAPGRGQPAKAKPDARPMRIVLGASGIAAFSALAAAIVLPPKPAVAPVTYLQQAAADLTGTPVPAQAPVLYVQLQPGQTAPAGARVIASSPGTAAAVPAAAAPAAAPQAQVAPKPIIVRTTQSGKVIP